MSTSKAYTVSRLSDRPDNFIAGIQLDGATSGYFEEPLGKETVTAFSEVPDPEDVDRRNLPRKIRRATEKSLKHYRVAQ